MRLALSLAILTFQAAADPLPADTVSSVVTVVRESLAANRSDKQIAKAISKTRLAERLDAYPIEELESAGAGPKTLQELQHLQDISGDLPAPESPPVFGEPAAVSFDEMMAAIRHARAYALNYSARLPDFICDETVQRFEDRYGSRDWVRLDVLGVKVSYADHVEDYHLSTYDGRATTRSFRSVRGAWSQGEFGSMMLEVFDPKSHAEFRWLHWTHLRRRLTQVYSYSIAKSNAHYKVAFGVGSEPVEADVGLEGLVYLDGETKDIVRVTNHAVDIPPTFPVTEAITVLDYALQKIGNNSYVLPLHADVRLGTSQIHTKNEVTFHDFRMFQGKSTITFDTDAEVKPGKD